MSYHIAKKHSEAIHRTVLIYKSCDKDFHSFYNLREHKRKEHGAQKVSGTQSVDVEQLMVDVGDKSLKEESETWKHFLLDSEIENGRHRVYNFAKDSLDPKHLLENLDVVSDSLRYAAKVNVAFGFILKIKEDGKCRYYYAHETITLLERAKLVATTEDLTKVKNLFCNIDLIESWTRERTNT